MLLELTADYWRELGPKVSSGFFIRYEIRRTIMNAQLAFVKSYAYVYGIIKDAFGVNLRGLGFAIRRLNRDLVLEVQGRKIFFNHQVGGCYSRHFAGCWNEPETHYFLDHIIRQIAANVTFIDVGANIGEFIVDISKHPNVVSIHAFEPIPDCVTAIQKSCELNGIDHCQVHQALAGSVVGWTEFAVTKDVSNSSVFSEPERRAERIMDIKMTTLDAALSQEIKTEPVILLLDVEGMEIAVLRGGHELVKAKRPLIIFEYNHVSRSHFSIADVAEELGPCYEIYRLRPDGKLDRDYQSAWNCVAVSTESCFAAPVAEQLALGVA